MADKPTPIDCPASTTFDTLENTRRQHLPRPTPFNSTTPRSHLSLFPWDYTTPMATEMQRERPLAPMPPPAPKNHSNDPSQHNISADNKASPNTHPSDLSQYSLSAHNKASATTLMSPPEPILGSFTHSSHVASASAANAAGAKANANPNALPMSPPISPCTHTILPAADAPATPLNQHDKDPVLYPADEPSPASPSELPLFAHADIDPPFHLNNRLLARALFFGTSIATSIAPIKDKGPPPEHISFTPQVMKHFKKDPKGWLRKQREQILADNKAAAGRYRPILPATKTTSATKTVSAKPARTRADRVSKPQPAPRPARNSISSGSSPAAPVAKPPKRISATPEPSRRNNPSREDKDFNALPDYCPRLDSLPNRHNSLKVDWRGQPFDLSLDPNAHLMHPDELLLAGILRLDCATYLTSKRRIFAERLCCLRKGKEFRKTDAQQACRIDVNKASKLWSAFDKVGWLDADWVRRFL